MTPMTVKVPALQLYLSAHRAFRIGEQRFGGVVTHDENVCTMTVIILAYPAPGAQVEIEHVFMVRSDALDDRIGSPPAAVSQRVR